MVKRQDSCRGAIAFCGKKPVLVLRLCETGVAVVVRLVGEKPPFHRSDILLDAGAMLLRNRVARTSAVSTVQQKTLRGLGGCLLRVPEETVLRVEAAEKMEAERQRDELLPRVAIRSSWRGPKLGSCGRKIGGAPSD